MKKVRVILKTIVFAVVMAFNAGFVLAQDSFQFQTEDSNIHCLVVLSEDDSIRCDIYEFTPTFTIAPYGCDLDWEGGFEIYENAPMGEQGCAGDTIEDPGSRVIGDGETISMGQLSCAADGSDLTCVNLQAHGFSLSRAVQSIF